MVIWTHRARADLKAIHDYIAKDSRQNAKRVANEIRRNADALAEPPHIGRKVPELNDPQLREISAYSWRIIYTCARATSSSSPSSTSAASPALQISRRTTSHRTTDVYAINKSAPCTCYPHNLKVAGSKVQISPRYQ